MRKWTRGLIVIGACLGFFASEACSSNDAAWLFFKNSSERLGVSRTEGVVLPFKIAWQYTPEGKTNGFVDWGPVAANGVVYSGDGLNNVLALDADSGKLLWQKNLVSNIFSVSLSEDKNILFVTVAITTKPSPTLFALNPKTGDELWNNMTDGQPAMGGMEGAPAIAEGKIYAGYLQYQGHGGLAAFNAATGKLLWHRKVEKMSPYTPITYADGRLFVGFQDKTLYCLEARSGKVVWSHELADLAFAAPTVAGSMVYMASGNQIYALEASSGNVAWQREVAGKVEHSSVSVYDKVLYVGDINSTVYALKAADGSVVWKNDLEKGPVSSSVIIDATKEVLYVGTRGNWLLALGLKDGKVQQSIQLSGSERGIWKAAPAIYGKHLYIGSLDRTLYALK